MPATPDWTIQSGTTINDEGSYIVLNVEVTGLTFVPDENRSGGGAPTTIGPVHGWRLNTSTGVLTEKVATGDVADGMVQGVTPYGFQASGTSPNITATFKVGIGLGDGGLLAVNADQATTTPKVYRLRPGWVFLRPATGAAREDAPERLYTSYPNLAITDASNVGKLPAGGLKLNVDAHAQWVKGGQGVSDLALWEDLSSAGNDLTGAPSSDKPDLDDPDLANRPAVVFNGASDPARFQLADPPAITRNATLAAVLKPGDGEGLTATIVGRYNQDGTLSWRLFYDSSEPSVVYQSKGSGSGDSAAADAVVDEVFAVFRRTEMTEGGDTWSMWINGVHYADGTFTDTVNTGTGDLGVGARKTTAAGWGDAFSNQINQLALYDTSITDLALSLVMHQMSMRAAIDLGTPLPTGLTQPYNADNPEPRRRLDRKPIAVINLNNGNHSGGDARARTGQVADWRAGSQQEIADRLIERIDEALNACDDFEILFNRPGGTYAEDIVPSYVFEEINGFPSENIVTATMWAAMKQAWDARGLSDHNNRGVVKPEPAQPFARRAWFYTGGGLPLNSDGTLRTDGLMFQRVVAPATPLCYKTSILDVWPTQDDPDERFRCFFLDAAVHFYGKFVKLVQDEEVQENFTLIGEAITEDGDARKGAPWFSLLQFGRAPWWNTNPLTGRFDKNQGYNAQWTTDWDTTPIYFAVRDDEYPYLHDRPGQPAGGGSNMTIGDIYRFILKGATPVAWTGTHTKVGAAWNYAMKRIPLNRWDRTGRACRVQR